MEHKEHENNSYKNCLQLYKLLSPNNAEYNFNAISSLIYEDDENLSTFTQKVEVPTTICTEDIQGDFLCCEFNRDGDSHRSPFTNKYFPKPEEDDGEMKQIPSELRVLEEKLNKIFKSYVRAYYTPYAIYSVYCDSVDEDINNGFLVNVRIKNPIVSQTKSLNAGCWDSNNIIEVKYIHGDPSRTIEYRISSSAYLTLNVDNEDNGKINASGYTLKTVSLINLFLFVLYLEINYK
jgi:capping protein beta